MFQTVEAVIEPDGQVYLLEAVLLFGARKALVTILEEQPVADSAQSSCNREPDDTHSLRKPNEEWLFPSMQALEAAYGEDEPDYSLHLIKVWNPDMTDGNGR